MKGSEFSQQVASLSRADREQRIYEAVAAGNFVAWDWFPVELEGRGIVVMGDYLAIGEPDDFVRMPVGGYTAIKICELLGYRMPTQAEVLAIYEAATVKLHAEPEGPPYDATMWSIAKILDEDRRTEKQRAGRAGLIAGHRKDILGVEPASAFAAHGVNPNLPPRLAFFGWFTEQGKPIQPNNGFHEGSYCDYSHGLRFVRDELDASPMAASAPPAEPASDTLPSAR